MTPLTLAFVSPLAVVMLALARVPVAVAIGAVSVAGLALVRGPGVAFSMLGTVPFEFAANWTLSAVPMFLLMGAVAYRAGLTHSLFEAARLLLARVPGGLAVAANVASAVFAAASGSSVATTAAMGRLAVPEMLRFRYDPALAAGSVAAAGTLGALIPPSIVLIIYGWYTQQPIAKLLIAGLLPGLLTAAVFAGFIVTYARLRPEAAPRAGWIEGGDPDAGGGQGADRRADDSGYAPAGGSTDAGAGRRADRKADRGAGAPAGRRALRRAVADAWPVPVLIVAVIGSIYTGVATPTEAGALGSVTAAVLAALRGAFTTRVLADSIGDALQSTVSIFVIAAGAVLFTRFLAFCGLPDFLVSLVAEHEPQAYTIIFFMVVTYIVLGMFLDPIGIMLITLPILIPLFDQAGLDMIWMGILVVKLLEIGLLTPPVGLNVFVVKSVVGDEVPLGTIFRGVGWFVALDALVILLLILFPAISLYLPSRM